MDLHRLGIKFFAAEPVPLPVTGFIPVFHTWIQKQILQEHLLVDVHNYSHIHQGPGILLVAHQGNFSIDMADGRMGLLYHRKQPAGGSIHDRLVTVLKSTLQGCSLLEADPNLTGRLRFRTDELLIIANDRLNTPNEEATLFELQPALSGLFQRILDGAGFTLSRYSKDPKERFAVRVQTSPSAGVKSLLARVS
jgi:hypothetical protein